MPIRNVLINGLSTGSGGGYTVGNELFRHIAMARPEWWFTLAARIFCPEELKQSTSYASLLLARM